MTERLSGLEDRSPAPPPIPQPDHARPSDPQEVPLRLCNLPPLNAIANQVLAATAKPDVSFKQLAAVMECDPAFAADALLIANSSLFGFASRVQVLRHALAVLGIDRIKALAVTVAMRSFMGKGGPLLHQVWQHSAACAMIARLISPVFGITGDAAYTLGLLHDIGRLGLLKSYPNEYSPVLASTFENVDQVLSAERALLRVDHGVAGAWLVKNWSYPATFMQACEGHHAPLAPEDPEILQVVKVSCRIAEATGFSAVRYSPAPEYDDILRSLPSHLSSGTFPSAADLRAEVEVQIKSFG
ncbi:MAG TPA: HDOD domain-containing protein [Bryobacteraceae bacterium]|nr:HDOD domain-containing protein [Bryobacteraceae bacterium]